MSHDATAWAFKQRGLKPAAKIVLLCLADRHNPDYGCFPSHKSLAFDTEMSERSVRDQLTVLEEKGLIRRLMGSRKEGEFTSTRYVLGFESAFSHQRQNLPSANPANGEITLSPAANHDSDQRQNLPTNLVRDNLVIRGTSKGVSSDAGTPLGEQWQLRLSWGEWAVAKGLTKEVVRQEAAAFKAHYLAKTGDEALSLDWKARWEDWVAQAIQKALAPKPRRPKAPKPDAKVRELLMSVLPEEIADALIAHRKATKNPMTDHAAKLIAKKLKDLPDAVEVVERSIENGWRGLYPEKTATVIPHPATHRTPAPIDTKALLDAAMVNLRAKGTPQ